MNSLISTACSGRGIVLAIIAILLATSTATAQIKIYVFEGVLPPGASSHSSVADGEGFVATFLVDTSTPDSATASFTGQYTGAVVIGTIRFSGGYLGTRSFTNSDVTTNNNFPYSVPADAIQVDGTGIKVTAYSIDTSVMTTDALPTTCLQFGSSTTTGFAPIMLEYSDAGGSVFYNAATAANVSFRLTDVDTWTSTTGGYFDEGANWFDGSAPDDCEEAVFDADALYDVTWNSTTGDVINRSLKVEDGNVLFRSVGSGSGGTIYKYGLTHTAEISGDSLLYIGNSSEKHQLNIAGDLFLKDGSLTVNSGSTLNVSGITRMAEETGSASILDLNNATVDAARITIGERGIAQVFASSGSLVEAFSVEVATRAGSLGELNVSGSTTLWDTDFTLEVGGEGSGFLTIEDGGQVNCLLSAVGYEGNSVGVAAVRGAGSTWNLDTLLDIGYTDNSRGQLDIEDGGLVSCAAGVRLGTFGTNPNNFINILGADSELYAGSDIIVGGNTGGKITVSDSGRLSSDAKLRIEELGTVELNQPGAAAEIFVGDSMDVEGRLNLRIGSANIDGDVNNLTTGSIRCESGNVTVIDGRLRNDGSEFFISGSSRCEVLGRFSGDTQVTGPGELRLSGSIEPGAGSGIGSFGEMSIEGNLTQTATALTQIELYSQLETEKIVVGGNASISGSLNIYDEGIAAGPGQEFVIIEVAGTRTGEFNGLSEGDIVRTLGSYDLYITYMAGDGNDVALYTLGDTITVSADSFTVTRGNYVSGGLAELAASDNADLSLRRNVSDVQSRVFVEFKSTSPTDSPSALDFTFEASVFARTTVVQSLDLYNYQTGTWEEVDVRNASRFADATAIASPLGDLSRFVEPGTGCIEARVRFQSTNVRQQFSANIDQVAWTITP